MTRPMRRRPRRRQVGATGAWVAARAALLFLVAGCDPGLTELVVAVDTSLEVPAELDAMRLEIRTPSGTVHVLGGPLTADDRFPRTIGLRPKSDRMGPIRLRAQGFRDGVLLVERSLETAFQPNTRHIAWLDLDAACVDVHCPVGRTCDHGACTAVYVSPQTLPRYDGNLGSRTDAAVMDSSQAVPASDAGTDAAHRHDAGDSGDSGSSDAGRSDGGSRDAGRPDAGPTDPEDPDAGGSGPGPVTFAAPETLAVGREHSCVLLNGVPWCWGRSESGELATDPTMLLSPRPVRVDLDRVRGICGGFHYTCALREDRTVWCWGSNDCAMLGDGTYTSRPSPDRVLQVDDAVGLACGDEHACVVRASGAVACWGDNFGGQLAVDPSILPSTPLPRDMPVVRDVRQVAAGNDHTCALDAVGRVFCWGDNTYGQLGDGTTTTRTTPTEVTGLGGVAVRVATNDFHTCAVLEDGSVRCWGRNQDGQLGDGSEIQRASPVTVIGVVDAVEVTVGRRLTCGRRRAGELFCVGRGEHGQRGDGTTDYAVSVPRAVRLIDDAVEVESSFEHVCARLSDDQVLCWGRNTRGQLGNGRAGQAPEDRAFPDSVLALP